MYFISPNWLHTQVLQTLIPTICAQQEHNYSLVTMSCILHIIWVNSCTRNKINFSKDNIARGLCTLVPFIVIVCVAKLIISLNCNHLGLETEVCIFAIKAKSCGRNISDVGSLQPASLFL